MGRFVDTQAAGSPPIAKFGGKPPGVATGAQVMAAWPGEPQALAPAPAKLLCWQAAVFAAAVLVGLLLYVLFPESSITRVDTPPQVLYREGRQTSRAALAMSGFPAGKLDLLLAGRLYLNVLTQLKQRLEGMEDAWLLLGRVHHELGDFCVRDAATAARYRLEPPRVHFERALACLGRAAAVFPAGAPEGEEARVFAAEVLLALERPQEALDMLSTLVERFKRRDVTRLAAERHDLVAWRAGAMRSVWQEAALHVHTRALAAVGREDEALAFVRGFLASVRDPWRRQGMLAIGMRRALATRGGEVVRELLDLVAPPVTAEAFEVTVAAMLFTGRYEQAAELLYRPEAGAIAAPRRRLMLAFAHLRGGNYKEARDIADALPAAWGGALGAVEEALRLLVMSEAAARSGDADAALAALHPLLYALPAASGRTEAADLLDFLLEPGSLTDLVHEVAGLLRRQNRKSEAAAVYQAVSAACSGRPEPTAGRGAREMLEQAAILLEEVAAERGEAADFAAAAAAAEQLFAGHPEGVEREKVLWRALEYWEAADMPLRLLRLGDEALANYPNLQSAPKLLHTLTLAASEGGLLERALDYSERLVGRHPESVFALFGLLERARLQERKGDEAEAVETYRRLLADARLEPDAFVYAAGVHELGILEGRLAERAFDPSKGLDAATCEPARRRLMEALERYSDARFQQYPTFRQYFETVRPAAWEALLRLELLAALPAADGEGGLAGQALEQWERLVRAAARELPVERLLALKAAGALMAAAAEPAAWSARAQAALQSIAKMRPASADARAARLAAQALSIALPSPAGGGIQEWGAVEQVEGIQPLPAAAAGTLAAFWEQAGQWLHRQAEFAATGAQGGAP